MEVDHLVVQAVETAWMIAKEGEVECAAHRCVVKCHGWSRQDRQALAIFLPSTDKVQ